MFVRLCNKGIDLKWLNVLQIIGDLGFALGENAIYLIQHGKNA